MREFRFTFIVICIGVSLFGLFNFAGGDFALATLWYQWQGDAWRLQHHWFTEQVMHQGVHNFNQWLLLTLLAYYGWQRFYHQRQDVALQTLGLLLLSLVLCFASVALLKRLLPTECPWDLQQFGGPLPYIGLFAEHPASMPNTQCFPAGHASIGFAWISLFFYYSRLNPAKATPALVIALTFGFTLGLVQQLRGAHFFSHDIASALLCWLIAALVFQTARMQSQLKALWRKTTSANNPEQRSQLR
jgi:membrane-associated PAP2 superfamily phosphatase